MIGWSNGASQYRTIRRDVNFNNAKNTTVLKMPHWNSITDVGNDTGMIGNIILNKVDGDLYWHDGFVWKKAISSGGGDDDTPWEIQEETPVAPDPITPFQNVKLNTTVPYVSPDGYTMSNDDVLLFGSDTLNSDSSSTGSDTFSATRLFFTNKAVTNREGAFRAGAATGDQWDLVNVGQYSVAFGFNNIASGLRTTVSGGTVNIASGTASTVGGGSTNIATALNSTIGGGFTNEIEVDSDNATIGGGTSNIIAEASPGSTIGGGDNNQVNGDFSTVSGG